MLLLSDAFREYLIYFLVGSFVCLGVLFAYVLIRHWVASLREKHEMQVQDLYQPAVNAVFAAQDPGQLEAAIAAFGVVPRRYLRHVGRMLVKPLRVASGSPVDAARAVATRLGL